MEVEVKPWLLPVSCYDYEYFPFEWRERDDRGLLLWRRLKAERCKLCVACTPTSSRDRCPCLFGRRFPFMLSASFIS